MSPVHTHSTGGEVPGRAMRGSANVWKTGRMQNLKRLPCPTYPCPQAPARDHDGRLGGEKPLRRRLDLIERHAVDEGGAALHIVDAELVELQLDQRRGDGARGFQIVDGDRRRSCISWSPPVRLRSAPPAPCFSPRRARCPTSAARSERVAVLMTSALARWWSTRSELTL